MGRLLHVVDGYLTLEKNHAMKRLEPTSQHLNHKNYNFLEFDWSINLCILY